MVYLDYKGLTELVSKIKSINSNFAASLNKEISDRTSAISNINTTLEKQTVVTTDATDTESAKVTFTYATGNTTTKTVTINAISNSEIDSLFN